MKSTHDKTPTRLAGDFKPRLARRLAATVFALAISIAAAAGPQMTTIEECVESGTDLVSLPGTAGGSLSASQCSGCPSVRLQLQLEDPLLHRQGSGDLRAAARGREQG